MKCLLLALAMGLIAFLGGFASSYMMEIPADRITLGNDLFWIHVTRLDTGDMKLFSYSKGKIVFVGKETPKKGPFLITHLRATLFLDRNGNGFLDLQDRILKDQSFSMGPSRRMEMENWDFSVLQGGWGKEAATGKDKVYLRFQVSGKLGKESAERVLYLGRMIH